jgi:hypothetical protein
MIFFIVNVVVLFTVNFSLSLLPKEGNGGQLVVIQPEEVNGDVLLIVLNEEVLDFKSL